MTTPSIAATIAESEKLIARGRVLRAELEAALGKPTQPQATPATTGK